MENKKKTSWNEDIEESRKKIESAMAEEENDKENKKTSKDNKVITNMLDYFKERFEGDE